MKTSAESNTVACSKRAILCKARMHPELPNAVVESRESSGTPMSRDELDAAYLAASAAG